MASSQTAASKPKSEQQSTAPSISLPKGGGAIKGIDEKFTVNPTTGTGSLSIPIFTSSGRNNFQPQLSLSYNSGTGNSPFGMGWDLSVPAITRKTDKGIPRYLDHEDSDTFILSGAEDLVPALVEDGNNWQAKVDNDRTWNGELGELYNVHFFRPRIEGLFARIERWTSTSEATKVFWRAITRDNITSIYGESKDARIIDPADNTHIFKWLLERTYDDKGNIIVYRYKPENQNNIRVVTTDQGEDLNAGVYEKNRIINSSCFNQRYLKRVFYGNKSPYYFGGQLPQDDDYFFEVVLDYGEHEFEEVVFDIRGEQVRHVRYDHLNEAEWPCRLDPFSSHRSGFEIRTYRLCRRILMFHHFTELGNTPCLVRSTDLSYNENPVATKLISATQTGYKRAADGAPYFFRSFPPIEFGYIEPKIDQTIRDVPADSLENLPIGLDNSQYKWVDLDGEGISGILTEQADCWYYKPNLGNGKFGPMQPVAHQPSLANLSGSNQQFLDLAGDGQLDLVLLNTPLTGFYERTTDFGWEAFTPFQSKPNINWQDPNLRFIDLNGDGHADILITEDQLFVWFPSLKEQGYGPANAVHKVLDEEKGPAIVFADGAQSIYLADMSGDGLTDIVRIRNGEVCYWPNQGYGRFGAKITMASPPFFDMPDQFDPKRIRLGDIDGSGTSDIFYLKSDVVLFWYNRSGNSWSSPEKVTSLPHIDNLTSINVVDLLGNGTSCLVWSSPLPGDASRPMRYIDLMGSKKPHLLDKVKNNLGSETELAYASSTKFYLEDKEAGSPWITRLAFPVHVVERVVTYDHVSRCRFISSYSYHHGYYDGIEREFRGFGRVEQKDSEEFAYIAENGLLQDADNLDNISHVPPVLTKTWFHTGAFLDGSRISKLFESEYYREPSLRISGPGDPDKEQKEKAFVAQLLPDTILPDNLTIAEEREACRALKGSMLRQEVYALDNTDKAEHPYTVAEQNFTIKKLQPKETNHHSVFFTHAREVVTYHYERNPTDPRIQHALTLEVDEYGNVLKQGAIGYGRRTSISVVDAQGQVQQMDNPGLAELHPDDRAKQTTALLTYTENRVTNSVESLDTYLTPQPYEALTFELTGYTPTGAAGRYQATDLVEPDPGSAGRLRHIFTDQVSYEDAATDRPCRRPIELLRTLYRPDDCGESHNDPLRLLPLGTVESLALPGESYKLAFTPGLLSKVFQRPHADQPAEPLLPDPVAVLGGQGGYLSGQTMKAGGRFPVSDADDNWWIPTGRAFFTRNPENSAIEMAQARQHFFLPRRYRDPFGNSSRVDYIHDLLISRTVDALENTVQAEYDYRVLQPNRMIDPNNNHTILAFDALGLVVGTAIQGKVNGGSESGDDLAGFDADLTQAERDDFVNEPRLASAANPPESEASPIVFDLLQQATTRIVYDLECFQRSFEAHPNEPEQWQPVYTATIARETHVSDLKQGEKSNLQISFSYSDGFGREIQKKIQAEAGPLDVNDPHATIINPRWVGSGWTIFNNKGKPVRQFEPFFDDTHAFKFGHIVGVSPYLFYDPIGRVVATLHPNHTWEKVVFTPWKQTTWDVNDTVTISPETDDYVKGFFFDDQGNERIPQSEYAPTWSTERIGGGLGAQEKKAAEKAAKHVNTPTIVHFDSIGRPFLSLAHNRFEQSGATVDEEYATRTELDIEGNQRKVIDALGRVVMTYDYYMAGPEKDENGQDTGANRIHQASMEAGERWILNDVAGQPIRTWDSRGHTFETVYDALRRPTEMWVSGEDSDLPDQRTRGKRILYETIEYGESLNQNDAVALNLRTRVFKQSDNAGVVIIQGTNPHTTKDESYDFKGNLLRNSRQLAKEYKEIPDWSQNPKPEMEGEVFRSSSRYDALNRPIQLVAPYSDFPDPKRINIIQPIYNDANLLERVNAWLEQANEPADLLLDDTATLHAVKNIDYDAKGQREKIEYGNGVVTRYWYDSKTFRLTHLYTRRGVTFNEDCGGEAPSPRFPSPDPPPANIPCGLQNLFYTYDPAGNITHIRDAAQQTIYFDNQCIEPSNDYLYDAVYRLIGASGRAHLGDNKPPGGDDSFRKGNPIPYNCQGIRNYVERYRYDAVGNILEMVNHAGPNLEAPGTARWRRRYQYSETNNQLRSTSTPGEALKPDYSDDPLELYQNTYDHDIHGNINRMPHLGNGSPTPNMFWDYKDQLRGIDKCGGGEAFYAYDSSGQRVRKVWEKSPGLIEERIYLEGFEIFRKHGGPIDPNNPNLERESLHIMDNKQRVALVETKTKDTTGALDVNNNDAVDEIVIRYQLNNYLGSACLELNEEGNIISYEEYYPYGSTSYQAKNKNIKAAAKRYRYSGKERDEESGFYYYGARYYAAWLGRWCSCDPAGLVDGFNLFQAFRQNPVNFKDLDGQQSVGELIEEKALQAAKEDRYVSGYLWSLADVTWSVFGAEGVSKVAADPKKADAGDYLSATIEVASVIPVGKLTKAGKGLLVAKEAGPAATKEVATVVAKEVAEEATEEVAEKVVKETGEKISKEAASKKLAQQAAAKAWRGMAGTPFSSKNMKVFDNLWKTVARDADEIALRAISEMPPGAARTKAARRLFNLHRGRFWTAVTKNPEAVEMLEKAGFVFKKTKTGKLKGGVPPIHQVSGEVLTLEHAVRLSDDPALSLTSNNLSFALKSENSGLFEAYRRIEAYQKEAFGGIFK